MASQGLVSNQALYLWLDFTFLCYKLWLISEDPSRSNGGWFYENHLQANKENKWYIKVPRGLWFKGKLGVNSLVTDCLACLDLRCLKFTPLSSYHLWHHHTLVKGQQTEHQLGEASSIKRCVSAESLGYRALSRLSCGPQWARVNWHSLVELPLHQESRKAVTVGVWMRCSEYEQIQCALLEKPEFRKDPQDIPRATEC